MWSYSSFEFNSVHTEHIEQPFTITMSLIWWAFKKKTDAQMMKSFEIKVKAVPLLYLGLVLPPAPSPVLVICDINDKKKEKKIPAFVAQ